MNTAGRAPFLLKVHVLYQYSLMMPTPILYNSLIPRFCRINTTAIDMCMSLSELV